jgi:pre-mRNA-splicing factor RBM22/SLT11
MASKEFLEFPIICELCCGENQHLRMTKENLGLDCRICLKPFTCYRWNPGQRQRFKRTEICSFCAKAKHVCQACINDLEYGLPVQVRDTILGLANPGVSLIPDLPTNEANRNYFMSNLAYLKSSGISFSDYSVVDDSIKKVFEELSLKFGKKSRSQSQNKNSAFPCSFFAKGSCLRGASCPYKHELTLVKQENLSQCRNRYFGIDDPWAETILDYVKSNYNLPNNKVK